MYTTYYSQLCYFVVYSKRFNKHKCTSELVKSKSYYNAISLLLLGALLGPPFHSIYWEQYYSLRQYPSLVPTHPPRILDPANPSNNLYHTGIVGYSAHERVSAYEPGDGDWTAFKKNIYTLDLNKPVQHWLCT